MSIDAGFKSSGFVDDREEQERWGLIDKKLSEPKSSKESTYKSNSEESYVVDGKMEHSEQSIPDSLGVKNYQKNKISFKETRERFLMHWFS